MTLPEIPAEYLQYLEQQWKYASDELSQTVNALRMDMDMRRLATGIADDSLSFAVIWDHIQNLISEMQQQQRGCEYLSMLATAALVRLARAPRATDPLEQMEKEMEK